MDAHQRGRSPSAGHHAHKGHSPSPSPQAHFQHQHSAALGFDAAQDPSSYAVTSAGLNSSPFLTTTQGQPFAQPLSFSDHGFLHASQTISQQNSPQFAPQGTNGLPPDALDLTNTANPDFNSFFQPNDPYLGQTLDPHILDTQSQSQSVNPSDLMQQMAATPHNAPTPPHLLPGMNSHHQTPSPHASPSMAAGQYRKPGHSRNASLDPSAAYGQTSEWGQMAGASFGGPRSRGGSDAGYSDVASSAHNSPYLHQHDSFDNDQPSPLLHAQHDPQLFQDPVPGFDRFNLNNSNAHLSAANSPHISPRLLPQNQQALPQFQPETFGLSQSMNPYAPQGVNGFSGQNSEPFPSLNQPMPEFGHPDAMSPPEINIDFAPPSRQASFEPPKPEHQLDALSPPDRCKYAKGTRRAMLTAEQPAVATGLEQSLILLAVSAHAPRPPDRMCIDHCRPMPQSPDLLRPLASRLAARRRQACPIATTSWIWPTPRGPHLPTARIRSARRSTPPRFSARCVRSALLEHTTSGRICARTRTSVPLSAVFAAKPLPVSTTASDTRGCTLARKSLCVAAISRMAAAGVVGGALPALTLWAATSDLKLAVYAFGPCWRRRHAKRANGMGRTSR